MVSVLAEPFDGIEKPDLTLVEVSEESPLARMSTDVFIRHSVEILGDAVPASGTDKRAVETRQFLGTFIKSLLGASNGELPKSLKNSSYLAEEYRTIIDELITRIICSSD